ncbi:MAG: tRNA lysidine(34) synthetase TilS [Cycloclasticus sp.]|nr:tRNA lysidine(34) synthetase TilS [Cycloclasticus sp.]
MTDLVNSVEQLIAPIKGVKTVVVAYSGGVDSHVLLHSCAKLSDRFKSIQFKAIYIDHGLHKDSKQWSSHCQQISTDLSIEFTSIKVDASDISGEGPEQAARHARYEALQTVIDDASLLMTAQHQDDQAETLMLQLLRGSGIKGLAAMPLLARFGAGQIARPFLDHSKQSILDYAKKNHLDWIEDPSNLDTSLNRNYLRQQVIPLIKQRWPAFAKTTSRTALHCAEADSVLADCLSVYGAELSAETFDCCSIKALSGPAQRLVLREWLALNELKLPSQKVLGQIQAMLSSPSTKAACVTWGEHQIRCFADTLYVCQQSQDLTRFAPINWQGGRVNLVGNLGSLQITKALTAGISQAKWDAAANISVRSRVDGERIKLANRKGSKKIKQLYQEAKVLPWLRDIVPLIYIDDKLAAVADLWLAEEFTAEPSEMAYQIDWVHPDLRIL